MIRPLTIAGQTFPNNLIQGPLAGISNAPFRVLTSHYTNPAFSYTEMISCKTLIHQTRDFHQRFVKKDPDEGRVCFQLSGNNPREVAEATKIVTDYGADLIDLNCGCPVKKIRGKNAGSKLLSDPQTLFKLITAMKQNTNKPVSIKIRVDGASTDRFNQTVAQAVADAGADFLVVHGRNWREHYEVNCRYDEIAFFVNEMKIPVIGNGDTACVTSLQTMLATGCAGVMISRASVGQPWIFQKLILNDKFVTPSLQEVGKLFFLHVLKLADLLNSEKFALLEARKIAKYYARTLPNKSAFCLKMNNCENINDLQKLCHYHFILKRK